MEKKCSEVRHENEKMKNTLARLEEHETQLQKHIDEKMHENTQLSSMLEQVILQIGILRLIIFRYFYKLHPRF